MLAIFFRQYIAGFTEGFDTPDLKDAQLLLHDLNS
jgi:hypothetical protein